MAKSLMFKEARPVYHLKIRAVKCMTSQSGIRKEFGTASLLYSSLAKYIWVIQGRQKIVGLSSICKPDFSILPNKNNIILPVF